MGYEPFGNDRLVSELATIRPGPAILMRVKYGRVLRADIVDREAGLADS